MAASLFYELRGGACPGISSAIAGGSTRRGQVELRCFSRYFNMPANRHATCPEKVQALPGASKGTTRVLRSTKGAGIYR
jgi:hypothetical protein